MIFAMNITESKSRFDGVDTQHFEPSNTKSQYGTGQLTRLTDLTAIEMGVYVTPAHPHPPAHPHAPSPTPSTSAVKSVKSVKPQDGEGWFHPPCRQTGCQFDGNRASGVVA